jgi:hypothetical protein
MAGSEQQPPATPEPLTPNPNPNLAGVGEEGGDGMKKNSCEEELQITQVRYSFTYIV